MQNGLQVTNKPWMDGWFYPCGKCLLCDLPLWA